MTVITIEQLTRSYGARRGICDVSLSVNAGEIFGFLGPNGAGKSTTIRVLTGFLKASAGTARVLKHDCWRDSTLVRQQIGYVSGDVRLYPWLTLRRGLQLVGEIRQMDLSRYGMELAERFRLEPNLPVRKMSRGNRQKTALVLALAHRPQLAILDEPTSGLDPLIQDVLAETLREMADEGRTVFFSSHTLSEVEALCSRVAIVRDGSIAVCESLGDLRRRAPRVIHATFDSEASARTVVWPDFVRLQEQRNNRCCLHMDGSAAELVVWAAQQPIVDLDISPPSLEAMFRRYYNGANTGDVR